MTTTPISLELLLGPQLSAFVDAGYDVVGISSRGSWASAIEARGIRHIPVRHATRSMRPDKDVLTLVELFRLFRRLRPDIVHTHNPKPGFYGRLAAQAAQVPAIVNTVHGLYAQPTDPPLRRAVVYGLERIAAACSNAELVQSSEDLDILRRLRIPASRLHLLGNGVDLTRFDLGRFPSEDVAAVRRNTFGAGPNDVVVGLVGRLVVEKGYREVFEAACELRDRFSHVRFVVAGPHDLEKADALEQREIERAAGEYGVRFLGMRDDVEQLYPAMDIYVLASHREGFPRSAMEAAAMGRPIVATDIRGCRQVVDHGQTGYLVPPRDPAALADAVARLVVDRQTREAFGEAARRKAAEDFDERRQVDRTLAIYSRLLAREGIEAPKRFAS